MKITPALEKLIATSTLATTAAAIEQAAIKEGMVTLMEDGIAKAMAGETTLEEVFIQVGE